MDENKTIENLGPMYNTTYFSGYHFIIFIEMEVTGPQTDALWLRLARISPTAGATI